jgi:hypothetical protein
MANDKKSNKTMLTGQNGARFTLHRQPLYDTMIVKSVSDINGEYRFFSSTQGLPLHLTNLRQNNSLEKGRSFELQGVAIEAVNMDETKPKALYLLARNSSIELVISEKVYLEMPVAMAAGKMYQESSRAGAVDSALVLQQFGAPSHMPISFGNRPLEIASQQTFFVRWKTAQLAGAELASATPTAGQDLHIRMVLKGTLTKPIQ